MGFIKNYGCLLGLFSLCWLLGTNSKLTAAPQRDRVEAESWTPANADFRSYYAWDDDDGLWTAEQWPSPLGDSVAIHCWEQAGMRPKGTIFIVHGYLEHCGSRAPLAAQLVAEGWLCAGVDLPGHGLSSGERGDIDDFARYGAALAALTSYRLWPRPWVALGHSTGCSAILVYLQQSESVFDYLVFEAPLLRSYLWEPSIFGKRLVDGFLTGLPIRYSAGPTDPEIIAFHKRDPLFVGRFPLSWMDALIAFEAQSQLWNQLDIALLVMQGDRDSAVDSRYNRDFLEGLFPKAEFQLIPGAGHQLLRGTTQSRQASWQLLKTRLASLADQS